VAGRTRSHIVIGAGALGSAAAYRLALAGAGDVLVLEQFELGHGKGTSWDRSRVIRHAYHSDAYTQMTHAMFESWAEVEEESGLFFGDQDRWSGPGCCRHARRGGS